MFWFQASQAIHTVVRVQVSGAAWCMFWFQGLHTVVRVLDPEATGRIDFDGFCSGVKQILELKSTCV